MSTPVTAPIGIRPIGELLVARLESATVVCGGCGKSNSYIFDPPLPSTSVSPQLFRCVWCGRHHSITALVRVMSEREDLDVN